MAMARGTNQYSATLSAVSATVALSCIAIAWAAYREGKRRGQLEQAPPIIGNDNITDGDATKVSNNASSSGSKATSNEVSIRRQTPKGKNCDKKSALPPSSPAFASLPIYPIGTLHSIYRLCVGTPRQGMLAPHSRGIITFEETKVSKDSILELQNYSHVFVVFVFHLNSNGKVWEDTHEKNGGDDDVNNNKKIRKQKSQRQFPSKIAPPSLGGKKVGVFSTRTPHRPNPIGFSLCRLDKVIVHNTKKKNKGKNNQKQQGSSGGGSTFSLLLSGLDIVDGTPILDIKPYVPHYDCVGYTPPSLAVTPVTVSTPVSDAACTNESEANEASTSYTTKVNSVENVKVPHWVDSGLQKRRNVTFSPAADQFLQDLASIQSMEASPPPLSKLQFYGPHSPWKDSSEKAVEDVKSCILELLGVDVRSAWQTKKARKGKFQAEKSSRLNDGKGNAKDSSTSHSSTGGDQSSGENNNRLCTQQIDNLLVQYTIEEPGSALYREGMESGGGRNPVVDERSMGSGAEDIVVVHSISLLH